MQCSNCQLRFNKVQRKPYILSCLHNICHSCLTKIQLCCQCKSKNYLNFTSLNYSELKLNISLLELLNQQQNSYDKTIKICVLGNSHVGKSSVVNLMKNIQFDHQYNKTIGYQYSFINKALLKNVIRYQIWDIAGDQKYRPTSQLHLKDVNIFLIVYDLSKDSGQNQVQKWLSIAEESIRKNSQSDSQNKSKIILVGNKADLIQKVVKSISNQLWERIACNNYEHIQLSCSDQYEVINQSPDYEQIWGKIQNLVSDSLVNAIKCHKQDQQIQTDKNSNSTDESLELQTQKKQKEVSQKKKEKQQQQKVSGFFQMIEMDSNVIYSKRNIKKNQRGNDKRETKNYKKLKSSF